jgi:hypothetical protein
MRSGWPAKHPLAALAPVAISMRSSLPADAAGRGADDGPTSKKRRPLTAFDVFGSSKKFFPGAA